MKKVVVVSFVICIILIFLTIAISYWKDEPVLFSKQLNTGQEDTKLSDFYRMVYQDIFFTLEVQNMKLRDDLNVIDEIGNKKNLKDFATEKKLVLRYSELNCNVCVDSIISCLKRKKTLIALNKLLILTTYHNKSNYYIFKRINQLDNIYQVDSIGCSLEEYNIPFMFLLDEDCCMKYPFIPHKEIMKETECYLNFIITKLK